MTAETPAPTPGARPAAPLAAPRRRWRTALGVVVLASVNAAVYSRSLGVPFIFDDLTSIPQNPNIQTLRPPWRSMSPPPRLGAAGGRPLVGLSLAVNYALGGLDVRGYHAFNALVHVLAALALWGVVARTLSAPRLRGRFGGGAAAFVVALVWSVHPLLTEPVTYIVQRTELLMGLFYLLTLYASLRAWDSARASRWEALAVACCALGMACKEVMVTAPLMVVLHDVLLRGEAWPVLARRRRRLYAGLGATWAVLVAILAGGAQVNGALGGATAISPLAYLWLQATGIVHYLRLCLWPHPLRLAYDWGPPGPLPGLPCALIVVALIAGAVAVRRSRPWLTFCACWFFLILAPTSSVLPLSTEPLAERRMYLPSAAVVALTVLAFRAALVFLSRRAGRPVPVPATAAAVAVAVAALGLLSWRRLADYRSVLAIWTDTVEKAPRSPVAHNNLGMALAQAGRMDDALSHFREAVALDPGRPLAHYNIGFTLAHQGKPREAIGYLRESLRLRPADADAHFVLGVALAATGEHADAVRHFEESLALRPQDAQVHREMANALVAEGDLAGAGRHLEESLRLDPSDFRTHSKYGNVLTAAGRHAEAAAQYRESLRLSPGDARTRNNLATALLAMGRVPEAVTELEQALRDDPRYALGHYNLANVLSGSGHAALGAPHYLEAMRLAGGDARLREASARKLAALAPKVPAAAEALSAAALHDADPMVREAARMALGRGAGR
jgi:tetratricopeptide (TPR) repeat protein